MKNLVKIFFIGICTILIILTFIQILNVETKQTTVYAASSSNSDLQLMARAINGEARGEPYEGQVAVRSSYFKSSKKFKISKYNSRSNIRKRCIYSSF